MEYICAKISLRSDVCTPIGVQTSDLSEIFWEVIESLVDIQGHLVTVLREGLQV